MYEGFGSSKNSCASSTTIRSFHLQDAGGASRYHFELARNLQQSDEVAIEMLMGLNSSVMPFATLQQPRTRVFGRAHGAEAGNGPLRNQ